MDLQSTIQDSFLAVSTLKSYNSEAPLYLYQLGTDELENLFSIIRTISHARNVVYLELIDRVSIGLKIDSIYERNPSLKKDSRLSTFTHDHSSIRSWTGNLNTSEIVLSTVWRIGCDEALKFLIKQGFSILDLQLDFNITNLKPFGVSEISENFYLATIDENDLVSVDDNDLASVDDVDSAPIHHFIRPKSNYSHNVLNFDNNLVHKANAVNTVINLSSKLSTISSDRLKRGHDKVHF